MKKILISVTVLTFLCQPAQANFTFLNASSTSVTAFSFDGSTTPAGTSNCASTTECPASVPINTAGSPLFITTNPGIVGGAAASGAALAGNPVLMAGGNGTDAYTLKTDTSGDLTVIGTGTFTVQAAATLNATPSLANGNGVVPTQGGSVLSATNGGYSNILQGNAVLSATNGLYANLLQGNAVLSGTNPLFANTAEVNGVTTLAGAGATGTGSQRETVAQDTATIAGSAPGTAGIASAQVVTVQGVASMTALLANPGTIATWGIAPVAAGSAPTNMQVGGLVYNSGGVTPSTGQSVALQGDANGYLEVNVKTGGGSGGTSSSFSATFPSTGTAAGAEYLSSAPTLTSGQMVALQVTSAGSLHTTVDNSNANGSAVSASSSPVVIASDQAAVAIKAASASIASGAIASGALAAGSISSGAAVSGAFAAGAIADLAHGQGAMAASVPVVLANNQTAADPCMFQAKTNVPISTASGTAALVTGVSAKKIYVCSLSIIAPSAISISLAEGSGTTCGTSNQAGVIGVATNGTAANGLPLAANGGLTLGNGGGTIAATATAADYLCLFQSGTVQIAGNLTYVQQ